MPADTENPVLAGHYPLSWDEFVGQDSVKRQLRIAAKSARARNTPMGHVLLSSPIPGVGKTSLAQLVAMELGSRIRVETGEIKPALVPYLFTDLEDGDVLMIDEIHRMVAGGKAKAEWLLNYMENFVISSPLGTEPAPRLTVIATTTDAGRLPETLRQRFEFMPVLEPYTDEQGAQIALRLALKILTPAGLIAPSDEVAAAIARAGNNQPRYIRRILSHLRDLVWADEVAEADGDYDLTEALAFAGVTGDGLSAQAQRYLLTLMNDFRGNAAGEKVIASRIGEVGGGMADLERTLLDKGLIALTGRGRMLTTEGMRRARRLATQ